jgi:hypothetical protein
MRAHWLALSLSLLAAAGFTAAAAEAVAEPKSEKSAKTKASKAKAKGKAGAALAKASTDEPKTTTVDKLPGDLKTVHVCSMPGAQVELDRERYSKSTLFVISCTAARGALTPFAVYLAKDNKGTGAKPVAFEGLKPDGSPDKLEMLYSATPAREAITKEGDALPNQNLDKETPWIMGAWKPDDRPEVCAVAAQWKLNGATAELYLWEEAKECPNGELPKYERKADRNPPPLVARSQAR